MEQARQFLNEQNLTVARDTRNFYRAVATDVIRVNARKNAIKSAQSALEATETGYEVGTREHRRRAARPATPVCFAVRLRRLPL